MITVGVELGSSRRYDVLVGDHVRLELARLLAERVPGARRVGLVTQEALRGTDWFGDLDPGIDCFTETVPEGEEAKALSVVEALCSSFARQRLARGDVVVAVGGGVVTDVAGYAAAAYHRGVAYVNVATSLLAQVDAAVGGKTGVNLPEGKNLVGAFWQPSAVLCDTGTLATLSPGEWACGRGEMAKYAFLGEGTPDASLLTLPLDEQVARCVAIKAAVVADDEREGGRRAVLNYGHTLAHALEAAGFADSTLQLRHGEAVAVGLVYAAMLAERLGRIDAARVDLHRRVVAGFDLSADLPAASDAVGLVASMGRDKKASHDLTFVLDGPRGVETVRGVDPADALATLAEIGETDVKVLLVSGPNLDLLGRRQPEIYGTDTLEDHVAAATEAGKRLGFEVEHVQSNDEGRLIDAVHEAMGRCAAIVVNAGALTHTSWSLHDALAAFDGVVVELHLSNPAAREPFRHTSVVAPVADGSIAGFGGLGYVLAMEAVGRLVSGADAR